MSSPIEEKFLCEIYYAVERNGCARISELAKVLNVTASYVSRMAKRLNESKLIEFERYGMITMTKEGLVEGKKLVERREILVQLYRVFGIEEGHVEKEVKNIENLMSDHVIGKIELFLKEKRRPVKGFS